MCCSNGRRDLGAVTGLVNPLGAFSEGDGGGPTWICLASTPLRGLQLVQVGHWLRLSDRVLGQEVGPMASQRWLPLARICAFVCCECFVGGQGW
jgi:hypothetical protein